MTSRRREHISASQLVNDIFDDHTNFASSNVAPASPPAAGVNPPHIGKSNVQVLPISILTKVQLIIYPRGYDRKSRQMKHLRTWNTRYVVEAQQLFKRHDSLIVQSTHKRTPTISTMTASIMFCIRKNRMMRLGTTLPLTPLPLSLGLL
jgi:hypothetical protein